MASATADFWLERATALDGRRVLVLGTAVSGPMCALMATECRAAGSAQPGARVERGAWDVVVAADPSEAIIAGVIAQAARALVPGGELVVRLPITARGDADGLRDLVATHGFGTPRESRGTSHRLVVASRLVAA